VLEVKPGQGPANAPTTGKWRFKKWEVEVGDVVSKGDKIAMIENNRGQFKEVRASKGGSIVERQEHLRPGYEIDEVMKDTDIAVIGKFPGIEAEGIREKGVVAPEGAVFKEFKAHAGDHVEQGQTVAVVTLPNSRRLADGRRLGTDMNIVAPVWGTVTKEQPLVPGAKVGDQMEGSDIAIIDMGPPWWVWLLSCVAGLCCILCCLYGVMKKQTPYTPMPPPKEPDEKPKPKPVPAPPPKPEGLRLDFEKDGNIKTVYAKYRPLGIKHNDEAPIISHDFTVNSYAEIDLEVPQHWKLIRIDDEVLNDTEDFKKVSTLLHNKMKDFPIWKLPIDIQQTIDGVATRKTLKFAQRPLGMEFSNNAPIHISKVYDGSPAAKLQETDGEIDQWFIVKIGKEDVKDNTDFREVMKILREGVMALDDSGKEYTK